VIQNVTTKNNQKSGFGISTVSLRSKKMNPRRAIGQAAMIFVVIVVIIIIVAGAYAATTLFSTKSTVTTTTTTTGVSITTSSNATGTQGNTVQIGSSSSTGNYLENGSGFTLYMFGKDKPGNGTSACTGACTGVWPPFYASTVNVPSGLSSSNFSTITRSDGSKQTTYNGWPLYYYSPDSSAGAMGGEGANQYGGLWYAIPPTMQQSGGLIIGGPKYSLGVAYKPSIGIYLTNSSGFSLYYRSTDSPNSGKTTCTTDTCEANWPVFYNATLNLPPGLDSSQFSTITPYNSTKIVTYNGYPLYYWAHDAKPGDATGQGIGSFYLVQAPFVALATTSTSTSQTGSVS
jgi:predicted lipoprotein with Yx(FWY)xxD motif